ncbi:cytochrome P450 [Mycolicibacterium komossense]|uniref:Cytochrome P450 n=1 Tax=Mycolicibacterium komossense TaxID=1779 RepID=A0ABT3CBT3_9MYCO|nr:cytochrome P450 [Mycolicibacterium komossense]MCV7226871.1 cytochrome P450 [Mycolicibacterium komossense]
MTVSPSPPFAADTGLPWDVAVDDAVGAIASARHRYGDTFALRSGGDNYLFTFSPTGVESFYALPEERASKGVADYLMLRRKLPEELFDGRRVLPGTLFRRDDVAAYLQNLKLALERTVTELGPAGSVDAFDLTRRLSHRMGLASWAGPGCAVGDKFDRLVTAFDILDGSDAFVHPDTMAEVEASGKRAERAALDEVVEIVGASVDRWKGDTGGPDSLFCRIVTAWTDAPAEEQLRGIAFDIALIHIASMSNLAAAVGWTMVDILEHPAAAQRIVAGDADLARRCALESTRLAQRSIMSRTVLKPVHLDTGDAVYDVPPGWTVATLLPLLNTTAAPDLDSWDPDRWTGHRLADVSALASPALVTAFGHGRHSCPAQPFSLAAMTTAVTHLLSSYEMTPGWSAYPRPVPAQIGGVARAEGRCPISYQAR